MAGKACLRYLRRLERDGGLEAGRFAKGLRLAGAVSFAVAEADFSAFGGT
jgi:hypothetical protein